MPKKEIGVGLIGFGTIGTGVVRVLRDNAASIKARLGVPLKLAKIADLDIKTDRGVKIPKDMLTTSARELIHDPAVDIVVELIGGLEPARTFQLEALHARKAVVTANKAVLSAHGVELAKAAEQAGVGLGFEASVGGGIPVIRTLKEAVAGDRNLEVYGIVNGTCNFILTEMAAGAGEFADVLTRAQKMGLAEADPSYDVDGLDSLHKLVILTTLAFGKLIDPKQVHVEGIRSVSGIDMAYARDFGYTIKLLAVARQTEGGIEARVHPAMVPNSHLLAKVSGAFNAVCLSGSALGTSVYYGRGAGMMPTATAVVADLMDTARVLVAGGSPLVPPFGQPTANLQKAKVVSMSKIEHEHYIRFQLSDKPGALAKITTILAKSGISIATVAQHEKPSQGSVPVVMRTHRTREAALAKALTAIARLREVRAKPAVIRVEEKLGEEG
ncbi:MAG TPA: homoserine dehydrogenase [Candidatus Binatia bacterium]|nr:homoserine dehydrogenase [Candidatus Binatia bacterium]